jgi:Kef-type K+ transport system membrane component KefB
MIVSATTFLWFNTIMVLGIALIWTLWDGRLFVRLWSQRKDRQDEFFGSVIGLVIVVIGLFGIIRHHLSL